MPSTKAEVNTVDNNKKVLVHVVRIIVQTIQYPKTLTFHNLLRISKAKSIQSILADY